MFDQPYETLKVDGPDGRLLVGRWGSGPRIVLAVHGVTGNHESFHALADQLGPDVTLLAPDLRGRGGSRDIDGPWGMEAHAADVRAVIESLAGGPVTLVGHSMGGFVAVVTAAVYPSLVADVVLVDGGFPLDLGPLAELPIEELLAAVLGPSLARLRMTFGSRQDYLAFWRNHPSLVDDWGPYVERYLQADLTGVEPALRSSVREDAVVADTESDLREGVVDRSLGAVRQPVTFLWAPRGVQNQQPGLYGEEAVARWREVLPQLQATLIPDVNHFSVLLSERGARGVAAALPSATAAAPTGADAGLGQLG